LNGPHPAFGTPLPLGRERGRARGGGLLTHGLRRGLLSAGPPGLYKQSLKTSLFRGTIALE